MNIWNTDVIATRLACDEIEQYEKTKYYIACFYLQVVFMVLPMFLLGLSYSITLFTFASFVTTTAVFHIGAIGVYKACAKYKKASVLDTLVVLSVPVSIKIQLVYWVTYVVIMKLFVAFDSPTYVWVLYGFTVMPVTVWVQFYLIKRAVEKNFSKNNEHSS